MLSAFAYLCTMENEHERLESLRSKLNEIHTWPSVYMFKFVLENDSEKMQALRAVFDESAEFSVRESTKGKYVSLTVRMMVLDADVIFDHYRRASEIGGILAL